MSWNGEVFQSVGARALYIYALESVWGVVNGSPNWRKMRLLPGENIERGQQVLRSREMRSDRMVNGSVNAGQLPGGTVPFELSAQGWNPFFWHLLGGSVTTTGPVAGLAAPGAPTGTPSTSGGQLAAGSYCYKISALSAVGETLPSSESAAAVTTGSTGKVTLTWTAVPGAIGYKIYGRTTGAELYMATVGQVTSWVDIGTITPAGALNAVDSSGNVYTHTIYGSVALPTGFTMEKGFVDQSNYIPYYGGRVSRVQIQGTPNQIVTGSWDMLFRQEGDPSPVSLNTGAAPASPTDQPFVASQMSVYESSSYTLLGTARQLTVDINNGFYADRGLILGDTLRNNLKPGARVCTAQGMWQFQDTSLYEKAVLGIGTALRVVYSNGVYSVQIDFPSFKFLTDNRSTPKATDEGPLEIQLSGESNPGTIDAVSTNVKITIKTPEATINT